MQSVNTNLSTVMSSYQTDLSALFSLCLNSHVSLCTHLFLHVSHSLTLSVWYFQCLLPSLTAALSHTFTRSSVQIPAVTLMNLSECRDAAIGLNYCWSCTSGMREMLTVLTHWSTKHSDGHFYYLSLLHSVPTHSVLTIICRAAVKVLPKTITNNAMLLLLLVLPQLILQRILHCCYFPSDLY